MLFGSLRSIIRPVTRGLLSSSTRSGFALGSPVASHPVLRPWSLAPSSGLHFLTDFRFLTDLRYPPRRPSLKSRRKRASYKPREPYRWVRPVPPDDVPPKNPNKGSVKNRNQKKRMRQRREFIASEKKKRETQLQAAKKRKREKIVERKMAAVARDRAWAERLKELQRLEAEKMKDTIA